MKEFILNFTYVAFIIVCFSLIITVLLQPGRSGGLGAAFGGGGGSTVFGASGGTSTFRKVTTGAAILFMLLSLLLAFLSIGDDIDSADTQQKRGLDFSAVAPITANEIPENTKKVEDPETP